MVKNFRSPSMKSLIKDLADTMRAQGLVGIAAPQIGISQQVFLTETRKTKFRKNVKGNDALQVYINPKIIKRSKSHTVLMEGCGSLAEAGLFGPVKRPKEITVQAYDRRGNIFTIKAKGLLAKIIQHEYDHLQGIICIDKYSDPRKILSREEYLRRK